MVFLALSQINSTWRCFMFVKLACVMSVLFRLHCLPQPPSPRLSHLHSTLVVIVLSHVLLLHNNNSVGLTDAKVQPGAPIAVLGAGTGMGQAYLTHNGSEYKVWPSEGGHSAFAATTVQDMHMVEFIKKDSNVDRVSVERVASGQGMFNIYKFLASVRKEQLSQKHYDAVMKSSTPAKEVNAFAQSGEDPVAVEAMQVFVRALGAEAGDLSLKTLPFGGLFVAGGMAPKVLWAMKQGNRFLQAFKNKGRLSSLLDKVPVYVVTVDEVGLIGCAVVALRLLNQRHDKGSKL